MTSKPQYSLPDMSAVAAYLRHPLLCERFSTAVQASVWSMGGGCKLTQEQKQEEKRARRGSCSNICASTCVQLFGRTEAKNFPETFVIFGVAALHNLQKSNCRWLCS